MTTQTEKMLRFDDQVVLVTGASRGLGRAYADLFSQRGAILVENDLDIVEPPEPETTQSQLASTSKKFAIAGSAIDGGALVERVLALTGRIDSLVLNAGFLRDRSFAKASEAELHELLDVHLMGPWRAAKAAWPAMVKQGFGRIIFTTSPAGLYGGFGQSAYSAAKAGLIGLTRTLAIEGEKHGILVNCVAPLAASRLSMGVLPPPIAERLPPESIAALVAFLCHPSCTTSGQVYEAAGGTIARQIMHRNLGLHLGQIPNLEAVRDAWQAINDASQGEDLVSSTDALLRFVSRWPDASHLGVNV
ncbi:MULTISPECIES: SDR family NAD(P)-dependent oxidoreductase [unclassified Pseudomonas]|uniref:SDR family NAD(P)-dependent oxidoreductase n=1 Tax=unclassified Pseudomonas TaxID=196821 RepID=UPI0015A32E5A|nr:MULTISPECIES: SDR family NAD(P)-dependent oxidoreductase [unclassified Pseudomonas]NWC92988.1 SDR family NAD(P)-dependent oxidoreductase [Pseudomonas sp. IPO3779]NWD19406.1 SDR family NAD(P)-dependent oxidoreductase [Pseudomonas sp. IPO3778]